MAFIQYCLIIALVILVSVNITGVNANAVKCSEFSDNCFSCVHHGSPCRYVVYDNKLTNKCVHRTIKVSNHNEVISAAKKCPGPTTTTLKSTTTHRPTTTQKPTTTHKPTTTRRPTTTQKPTTTRRPTTTQKPNTTTRRPTTTWKPTTTRRPTTTQKPTTTRRPTTTRKPTTTRRPTTTQKPTTTKRPTTTQKPTTTKRPTTTKKPTTTKIPTTTQKPTTTQIPTTTDKPSDNKSHFNGISFLGGILLTLGVILIIFFAFKFYKARRDRPELAYERIE